MGAQIEFSRLSSPMRPEWNELAVALCQITISGVVWLYLAGSGQQVQLDVGVRQSVGVHWLQALAAQTEVRISAASDLRFPQSFGFAANLILHLMIEFAASPHPRCRPVFLLSAQTSPLEACFVSSRLVLPFSLSVPLFLFLINLRHLFRCAVSSHADCAPLPSDYAPSVPFGVTVATPCRPRDSSHGACAYLCFDDAAVQGVGLLLVQEAELQAAQGGCTKENRAALT